MEDHKNNDGLDISFFPLLQNIPFFSSASEFEICGDVILKKTCKTENITQ